MNNTGNVLYCMLLLFSFFIFSCNNQKENNTEKMNEFEDIQAIQKSRILNREIKALKKITGDSINLCNKVIFLYNGFDCETCIDIGYEITRKIDSILQKQYVYVISTSANIARDQFRNNYLKYVYNDENDLIRKELKYIYTPVLLKNDSSMKIKDVFFPNYSRNFINETKFINQCINSK